MLEVAAQVRRPSRRRTEARRAPDLVRRPGPGRARVGTRRGSGRIRGRASTRGAARCARGAEDGSPGNPDGDKALPRVALQNLLGNAFEFTSRQPHARVQFGRTEHAGQTAFFVRDNGVGFNMKYSGKLFGVFQRLHRAEEFEGTGVGLATVARIIGKHGGRIWAEAEVNKGAAFFFTLPPLNQKSQNTA